MKELTLKETQQASFEILKKIKEMYDTREKDFANGRTMRQLFDEICKRQAGRLQKGDISAMSDEQLVTIEAQDIPYEEPKAVDCSECLKKFDGMVGLESVKKEVTSLAAFLTLQIKRGETNTFQGKHYVAISRVDPCYIWIYNKNTIDDCGFDQPADLFHEGKWNWDTMSEMCVEFTNAEEDKFALDGWYYENALTQSTGLPLISMTDGKITNNIADPKLAKAQDMMYELQKNGVVYPKHEHEWKVRGDVFGEGIGSGLTLFYPIGLWAIEDAPSVTKPYGDLSAGDVMFVPVPCSADSDAQYVPSRIHGFCICKNAPNPEGVAAFLDCTRYAETDEAARKITLEQFQKDYGWTDEMMDMREEIYALAAEHPVFEFSQGVSKDLASLADNVIKATMHPAEPETWSSVVASNQAAIDYLIDEAQEDLG